jgi:hypothetical protein
MELLEGESLAGRLRRVGRLRVADAVDIACQTAAAVAAAHDKGIVHRDLKPANLFLVPDPTRPSGERVKVLDLGIAKLTGELASPGLHTHSGAVFGTPCYMSPEQCLGIQHEVDGASDIYALGCILYEMLCGQPPFVGVGHGELLLMHVQRPPEPLGRRVGGIPQQIEDAVARALAKRPGERFASMAELQAALHDGPVYTMPGQPKREGEWPPPEPATMHPPATGGFGTEGDPTALLRPTRLGTPGPRVPSNLETLILPKEQATGSHPPGTRNPDLGDARPSFGDFRSPPPRVLTSHTEVPAVPGDSGPMRRGTPPWRWFSLLGLAAGAAAGGLMLARTESVPTAAAIAPAAAPMASDEDAAAKYLDAAEALAKSRRLEPATDMMAKAAALKVRRPDLNIRLARLRDTLATATLVKSANASLKRKQWRAAMESAKQALDRDPDNGEAVKALASARAADQTRVATGPGKTKESTRDGSLAVVTQPAALVYVDDELVGRTPLAGRPLVAGRHVVELRAQGFRPITWNVRVKPGQALTYDLPLVAAGTPPGARSTSRQEEAPPAEVAPAGASRASMTLAAPPSAAPALPLERKASVPRPALPRVYLARDTDDLLRISEMVESQVVSLAGVSREYAAGITGPLRRLVRGNAEVYPVAMYYFIIREAGLHHDVAEAAAALAAAHANGAILRFRDLPAVASAGP